MKALRFFFDTLIFTVPICFVLVVYKHPEPIWFLVLALMVGMMSLGSYADFKKLKALTSHARKSSKLIFMLNMTLQSANQTIIAANKQVEELYERLEGDKSLQPSRRSSESHSEG